MKVGLSIEDAMCFTLHSRQKHILLSYVAIGNANFNHLVKVVLFPPSLHCK